MKPYLLGLLAVGLIAVGIEGFRWWLAQTVHYDTALVTPDANVRAERATPNLVSLRGENLAVYVAVPDRVARQQDGQPLTSVPIRVTIGNGAYIPVRVRGTWRQTLATVHVHPVPRPDPDAPEDPAVWTSSSAGLDQIDPAARVDRIYDCPAALLPRPGWFKVKVSLPWWRESQPLVAFFELR